MPFTMLCGKACKGALDFFPKVWIFAVNPTKISFAGKPCGVEWARDGADVAPQRSCIDAVNWIGHGQVKFNKAARTPACRAGPAARVENYRW